MFTKLQGVTPDQIPAALDSLTDDEWADIDAGYLQVAAHELGDWWKPMLGLHPDVDVITLLCQLYQRSQARMEGQS